MLPDSVSPDERSRIRNAARDMADAYLRFEKATERLRRAMADCGGATGPNSTAIAAAVQEGCSGAERVKAFNAIAGTLR